MKEVTSDQALVDWYTDAWADGTALALHVYEFTLVHRNDEHYSQSEEETDVLQEEVYPPFALRLGSH